MQKFVIARLQVSTIWWFNIGIIKRLGFSLTLNVGTTYLQNLFIGKPFTTSNCQVPSICTQNLIRLVNASNWPTSCCKKVTRLLAFRLTQQHTNN